MDTQIAENPCPTNQVYDKADVGAVGATACVCDVGFFQSVDSTVGKICIPCNKEVSPGLICDRENLMYNHVSVKDGYFRVIDDDLKLVAGVPCLSGLSGCKSYDGSGSALNVSCAEGYLGLLCSECAPKYYNTKTIKDVVVECLPCDSTPQSTQWLEISLSTLMGLAVIAFFIRIRLNRSKYLIDEPEAPDQLSLKSLTSPKSSLKVRSHEKKSNSVLQRLALSHLQVISILGRFDFKWPVFIQTMFKVSATASSVGSVASGFNLSQSMQCQVYNMNLPAPVNSLLALFYQLGITVAAIFLYFFVMLCFGGKKKKEETTLSQSKKNTSDLSIKQSLGISLVFAMYMMHSNITSLFFQLFSCVPIELVKHRRLQGALDVVCYSWESHLKVILPLAIVGCVFTVIVPVLSWNYLRQHRSRLRVALNEEEVKKEKEIMIVWGLLYDGYRYVYICN
jgi:hypothetical protein